MICDKAWITKPSLMDGQHWGSQMGTLEQTPEQSERAKQRSEKSVLSEEHSGPQHRNQLCAIVRRVSKGQRSRRRDWPWGNRSNSLAFCGAGNGISLSHMVLKLILQTWWTNLTKWHSGMSIRLRIQRLRISLAQLLVCCVTLDESLNLSVP